jgi:hypothetical protein
LPKNIYAISWSISSIQFKSNKCTYRRKCQYRRIDWAFEQITSSASINDVILQNCKNCKIEKSFPIMTSFRPRVFLFLNEIFSKVRISPKVPNFADIFWQEIFGDIGHPNVFCQSHYSPLINKRILISFNPSFQTQ